jgi:hypothetical protein
MAGRVVGAGLLGWMAWIHLHLWSAGYRHLHVIGPWFLVNFVLGAAIGLAEVAAPDRWLVITSVAGCVLAGGTLALLAVSINIGLFGFHDFLNAPFVRLSLWAEGLAVLVLAATAVRAGRAG